MYHNDRNSMIDYLLAWYAEDTKEEYAEAEARFEAMSNAERQAEIEEREYQMSKYAIHDLLDSAH